MSYLKGNYELDKKVGEDEIKDEDPEKIKAFERFARERLGGSIAFVMKDKTFVWTGDEAKRNSESAQQPASVQTSDPPAATKS